MHRKLYKQNSPDELTSPTIDPIKEEEGTCDSIEKVNSQQNLCYVSTRRDQKSGHSSKKLLELLSDPGTDKKEYEERGMQVKSQLTEKDQNELTSDHNKSVNGGGLKSARFKDQSIISQKEETHKDFGGDGMMQALS